MSQILVRTGFCCRVWTPSLEQVRFANKIKTRNPLPPHFARAAMLRLCEPQLPPEVKACKKREEMLAKTPPLEENPYGVWLSKQMRKKFYDNPMIAIFHPSAFTQHQHLHARGMLFDNNFEMILSQMENRKVAELALRGTKFEPALRVCTNPFVLGYCASKDVKKLIRLTKKIPMFTLIAVVVDNRLLHKADFEKYSLYNLDTSRASLCQTLSLAGGKGLSTTLESNATSLCNNLSNYVSTNSTNSSEPDGPSIADSN